MAELIVSIDEKTIDDAKKIAAFVPREGGILKLGLEFFCAQGPSGIAAVQKSAPQADLFLDLKLHDIPNTVAQSVASLAPLKPRFLTLHASGGQAMMRAAAAEAKIHGIDLLAVTVLTSLENTDLQAQNINSTAQDQVLRLAELVLQSGLNHIVCSPLEIEIVRKYYTKDVLRLVVPGIRLAQTGDDQKRVMSPAEAVRAGADYLVVGRPITRAANPQQAYQDIRDIIQAASLS